MWELMIENIKEKEKEIKEIYFKYRDTEKIKELFCNHLMDYFEDTTPDWLFFVRCIRTWKTEERQKDIEETTKNITDEEALELQDQNRKRSIVLLSRILTDYQNNPKAFKNIPIKEVSQLYHIIQSAEEAMRRTKIAKGKLGLEAARTFLLPYQRLSVEEILKLKKALNASFERIIKLKSGERSDAE